MHFFGIPPSARPSEKEAKTDALTNIVNAAIMSLYLADTLQLISKFLSHLLVE